MLFQNREAAGKLLAKQLLPYRGNDTVVVALPRGGVVVAAPVAEALGTPLDIISVRKIGHPSSPEYAIGTIDEYGETLFSDVATHGIDPVWLEQETVKKREEAQRRATLYRGEKKPLPLLGKTVLLIDDGMATGLTMRLAVRAAQAAHPQTVIVAVPVASPEAAADIKNMGIKLVLLSPPSEFASAVAAHNVQFEQGSDAVVIILMN